ncbi:MAG: hypothetical protein ABII90_03405 [Bacteroidota bacterium]
MAKNLLAICTYFSKNHFPAEASDDVLWDGSPSPSLATDRIDRRGSG